MTLVDNETGKKIINPYITLYDPERNKWTALNTETFGRAQDELIDIHDEQACAKYSSEGRRLYPVVATVGKRNIPTLGTVRTNGANDAVSLVPLGHILEDVVEQLFPNSFIYLKSAEE